MAIPAPTWRSPWNRWSVNCPRRTARGNSGVILSQILRGLADTFAPLEAVSPADLASGLRRAADAAYQAVLRPVEGTILTVVRLVAESVERAIGEGIVTLAE